MAMTLGSMSSIATQTLNLANKAATSATSDPLTKSLGIANQRVTDQLSQTNVQLSSYGQSKSGFAALQTTGKTLCTLTKEATASDVSKAAQSFASAFNSTTNAVSSAVNGSAGKSGALANDQLARLSGNDLRRVITNSGGASELQKIGISVGQSGTLTVDSKALEKALAANPDAVKGTLSISGGALDYRSVSYFHRNLDHSQYFVTPALTKTDQSVNAQGVNVVKFEMTVTVRTQKKTKCRLARKI